MKIIISTTILFFSIACTLKNTNNEKIIYDEGKINIDTNLLSNGIKINIPIPSDFKIDSIKAYDKKRNLQVLLYFPLYKNYELDNELKNELIKQKNDFLKKLDGVLKSEDSLLYLSAMTSEFIAYPRSIYKNDKFISYSFHISYYQSGAPHPMEMFYSFNYDLEKQKNIKFSEYFNTQLKTDTSYFLKNITNAINREFITLNELYEIDFNIENDSISFNFDDYEIASYGAGMVQGKISKKQLFDKIKLEYR